MKHLAPVAALTLTAFSIAGGAVAAEMPKDFQGKWCSNFPIEDFVAHRDYECESGGHENPIEITATEVKVSHLLRRAQNHEIRCLPLRDDFSQPSASAG
jgi:hypothetical protein